MSESPRLARCGAVMPAAGSQPVCDKPDGHKMPHRSGDWVLMVGGKTMRWVETLWGDGDVPATLDRTA